MTLVVTEIITGEIVFGSDKAWCCRMDDGENIWVYADDIQGVLDHFNRCGWII